MPEEDVRAVNNDGTKTKEGLHSMLRESKTNGMEDELQRGEGDGNLEGCEAQEKKGDARANQLLQREVG